MVHDFSYYVTLILISFAVVTLISTILRRFLDVLIRRKSKDLHADPTNFIFIKNSISFILYAITIFWIIHKIPYFQSLGAALFAGAGVLAAVVGLASQKAFSNIIGGLFILIFKPFRVGDIIEIANSRRGVVEEITLRHTVIKDYESRRIVIPNSQISDETIVNSSITDEKIRKHIEIGISYDSDINLAIEILKDEISTHPLVIDNRDAIQKANKNEIVDVKVISLADSAVILRANAWTNNIEDAFQLQCAILRSIKERFDKEGVEIPYPHRTVVVREKKK